jgi:hypothetical protein
MLVDAQGQAEDNLLETAIGEVGMVEQRSAVRIEERGRMRPYRKGTGGAVEREIPLAVNGCVRMKARMHEAKQALEVRVEVAALLSGRHQWHQLEVPQRFQVVAQAIGLVGHGENSQLAAAGLGIETAQQSVAGVTQCFSAAPEPEV